jgi:hypothetical protein
MTETGLAKYGGRGPKIAGVIFTVKVRNFLDFFVLAVKCPRFPRYMALSRAISRDVWCMLGRNGPRNGPP